MDASLEKQQLIRWLRAEMSRQSGRTYNRIELEAMSVEGLRDLQRLLRDLDAEKRMAVQRAQLTPWRST
jgi:hypothetical protein